MRVILERSRHALAHSGELTPAFPLPPSHSSGKDVTTLTGYLETRVPVPLTSVASCETKSLKYSRYITGLEKCKNKNCAIS